MELDPDRQVLTMPQGHDGSVSGASRDLQLTDKNFERHPPRLQPYWPVFCRFLPFFF